MRMTHNAINQLDGVFGDVNGCEAEAALVLGGLCCHKTPQRPRRFRLLLVILKLSAVRFRLPASSSFRSRSPINPFPACTSSSRFLSTTVEDSMFFAAA